MKTLQELRREVALNAREIHENEFRELIQIYERKGWMRIVRAEEVIIGDVYGTLDGLVKVKDNAEDEGNFWGEVIEPLHKDINKGDVFEYSYEDLYVGNPKDIEALKDWIINGAKHKNIDVVNTKPMQEMFERTLDDDEIENLIDKARQSALAIKKDKKRDKEEREQAKEVLDFIDDVEGIWDKKKSLHPSQVVSLMRIVSGTSSSNPAGWGFRSIGWKKSPDGKVPQDFRNEELTEGKMTDGIIKAGALMTKRYIINKGQEGDVSAQINGLASLILFAIAATDRGESFMSKALATSGFFKGASKK
jgi:hypothetical protein